MIKLYNTLTRRKEEFIPLAAGHVGMYVCGPTVYGLIHIGNARPLVVFDAFRRYLTHRGYSVNFVSNFTDIDDKIINKAIAEDVPFDVITERYMREAVSDSEALNVLEPTHRPLATEEIGSIIEMIRTLTNKGFAYEQDGAVFFETGKFPDYGKLSKKNLEELEAGARVEVSDIKRSPADFVLWKPAKPGEPVWHSPWGPGRPGWHIECSAMSGKYLGSTFDIHAGGEDLEFPHHENEIAQSESANGVQFARYWLHNGMVNVDNQKMSKSAGNFFTLRDIAEKYPYNVIRFFILMSHYRSPMNFSDELLGAAESALTRIKNCVSNIGFSGRNKPDLPMTDAEKALLGECADFRRIFEESLDDDFNTADAVSAIFDYVRFANINLDAGSGRAFYNALEAGILEMCGVLGVMLEDRAREDGADGIPEAEIGRLIEQRARARKDKDFKTADDIRARLLERGIVLEDTPAGVRWSRK